MRRQSYTPSASGIAARGAVDALRGARMRAGAWRAVPRGGFAALALLLLATAGAAAGADAEDESGPAGPQTWYASAIAQSEAAFNVTHYWSKGPLFLAETVIAGRRIVTIVNGATYYTIDPVRNYALAIERSELAQSEDATRIRPFGDEYEVITKNGGELVREEELGGKPVELYRLTNDAGRVQVWVTPNSKLPIRVERFRRDRGEREELNYVNWLTGMRIHDGFFEPNPKLRIKRMGYEDYVRQAITGPLGPAPPLFAQLLHGEPDMR